MKNRNKTILIFMLVLAWITLWYSQAWAFRSLVANPLKIVGSERLFTCKYQGPYYNKTVEVHVSYEITNGISKPARISAIDKTDPKNSLKAVQVEQPYFFMKEKNPTNPDTAQVRAGASVNTGPPHGSIICTKKNYPVFVWGNQAWFIKRDDSYK